MAKVLILGGGFGGVPAARRLREQLSSEHEIIVIDKRDYFMVGFRKTWAMLGETPLADGQRKLADLEKHGIQFIQGTIEQIDPENRSVVVDGREMKGDAMIVALGAELVPQSVPGFLDYALNVYNPALVQQNAAVIEQFKGGRVLVGVFGKPYKCPPAPYEMAILLKEKLQRKGVEAAVEVFTPLPASLPVLGDEGCATLDSYLFIKGIPFKPNRVAVAVEDGIVHFEDGIDEHFDLLLGVAPHRPPKVVRESGLTQGRPWVKVDARTLETGFENVYAIGDVTMVMMANGKPLPKAGVFAQGAGEVAAGRIASRILGRPPKAVFEGRGGCFLEVGDGKAVMVEGHFLAEGQPDVALTPPSTGYMDDKWDFERSRLESWFD